MPVFYHPARVIVDEGHSPVAVIAGLVVLAAVTSAAAAILTDLAIMLLVVLGVAVAGSLAILVVILRRTGLSIAVDHRPAAARRRAPAAVNQAQRRAITPARVILRGQVVHHDSAERGTP